MSARPGSSKMQNTDTDRNFHSRAAPSSPAPSHLTRAGEHEHVQDAQDTDDWQWMMEIQVGQMQQDQATQCRIVQMLQERVTAMERRIVDVNTATARGIKRCLDEEDAHIEEMKASLERAERNRAGLLALLPQLGSHTHANELPSLSSPAREVEVPSSPPVTQSEESDPDKAMLICLKRMLRKSSGGTGDTVVLNTETDAGTDMRSTSSQSKRRGRCARIKKEPQWESENRKAQSPKDSDFYLDTFDLDKVV